MATPHPTEGELAILRAIWSRKGPTTVREVHDELSRSKDTAYTTVLKMLTIMAIGLEARAEQAWRVAADGTPVAANEPLADFGLRDSEQLLVKLSYRFEI